MIYMTERKEIKAANGSYTIYWISANSLSCTHNNDELIEIECMELTDAFVTNYY